LRSKAKKAEALREMDAEVEKFAATYFRGPLSAAEFYSILGDAPKALEWLDRAGRLGDDREDWMRRDSLLAGVREHPGFQQILSSVAYRAASGRQRHARRVTMKIAPPTAIASSSSAIGRSFPPVAFTSASGIRNLRACQRPRPERRTPVQP
jgi:hypothetical protein